MAILRMSVDSIQYCTVCECGAVSVKMRNAGNMEFTKDEFKRVFGVSAETCAKREKTWVCKVCM